MKQEDIDKIFATMSESLKMKKEKTEGLFGGSHIHTADNPYGIHKHKEDDEEDGAHQHTPENPKGEHVHGKNSGMALMTGAHEHINGRRWGSYHSHPEPKSVDIVVTESDGV